MMDKIIHNINKISHFCEDLIYCPEHGIMYQKDMSLSVDYGKEYFEKYIRYEDTPIARKLNFFRIKIAEKYSFNSLLDVGIGSGEFIKNFNGNRNVFGYDINAYAISWLKERKIYINPYKSIPSCVDCITFFDSLEHMKNPGCLLDRIKNDTYVIISIPIFKNLLNLKRSKHYRPNEHYYYFTLDGFVWYMEQKNFNFLEFCDCEIKAGREDIFTFVFIKNDINRSAKVG